MEVNRAAVELEQLDTLRRAMPLVRDFHSAVDGGANKGDWTEVMAERFESVLAFEPAFDVFSELVTRFHGRPTIAVFQMALWRDARMVRVLAHHKRRERTRGRYVAPTGSAVGGVQIGTVAINGVPLDRFGLERCGLLKLDVEGAELEALQGAVETIKRCRPVIIMECMGYC